jgi:Xaa-Pro aminopeptidase
VTKLIFTEEDMRYFTGEPLPGFLIVEGSKKYLYTSDFDLGKKVRLPILEKKRTKDHFIKLLKQMKVKKIEIDVSKLSVASYNKFVKNKIKLIDISKKLDMQMARKKPNEIKKIKSAAKLADEAMQKMKNSLKVGVTEQKINAIGQTYLEKCDAASFPFIVEFGQNTMYTHYFPTRKKLKKNEMVICDIGFKYDGYCSDLTRSFCIKPDVEKQWMYELAKYAQDKAFSACRKNVSCGKIYKIVEDIYKDNNVLKYWKYGLGHGIGLRIHEYPSLHKASKDKLYLNSVFTIEPGLAIPKIGGCRVEDDYVMKNKAIQITKCSKDLKV